MTDTPEWLSYDDEGNATVALAGKGMTIDGTKVAAVTMREPTVQDQLASDTAKGAEAAKELTLMANLCDVAPDDLKGLSLRNYKRLQVALVGFID